MPLADLEDEVKKWLASTGRLASTDSSKQADAPPPNPYPLSQQVLSLEKREQEAIAYCEFLEAKCRELSLAVERSIEERDKERSDHEARCKSLEAAKDTALQQVEEEKEKFKELNSKNESLVAELAAASEENTRLSEMLEEKTHESYVFRCACCVIFKLAPSTSERVTIRALLRNVLVHYIEKRKREREGGENQAQDQNNEEQQSSEPRPSQESSPCVTMSDAAESDAPWNHLPLVLKRQRSESATRQQRFWNWDPSEDTDDDMPLSDIRKKRTKKTKTASSHEKASTAA